MYRPSRTYKFRVPGENEQTGYFTIVGEGTPEAFFLNSKEMRSFQWITALMTSYSRQLSCGACIEQIIKDMKETFDPNGHYIIPDGTGREANSIIHHLALILEQHMEEEKNRILLLDFYRDGLDKGMNHLDASTYSEEQFNKFNKLKQETA